MILRLSSRTLSTILTSLIHDPCANEASALVPGNDRSGDRCVARTAGAAKLACGRPRAAGPPRKRVGSKRAVAHLACQESIRIAGPFFLGGAGQFRAGMERTACGPCFG